MLPRVKINFSNGALGTVAPSADCVAGLIVTAAAVSDTFVLGNGYIIHQMSDLATLGLNSTNNAFAYKHIKEFYDAAGDGAELWLMGVADSVKPSDAVDKENAYAKKLILLANGRIRFIAVAHKPAAAYEADIEDGLDGLRYNRVIVATDADVDGMHIRLLMITFFLQFFPELIKKGHVYVLQTPLFRVRNRRTKIKNKKVIAEDDTRKAERGEKKGDFITRYCYSDEERLKAIAELGPDPEITRFKGLGEISPEEFSGFIGPDIRLEQVTLHKNDQVQKLLEYYMGKNTMERQNFIIENLVVEEDRPEEEDPPQPSL